MTEPAINPELLEYDGLLLDQLGRIEETINKFAIQNYAAAGAVLAAHLTFGQDKFPGWLTVAVVTLLGLNFALALNRYLWRLKVLYGIHRTIVDCWFHSKSRAELYASLRQDEVSRKFLDTRTISSIEYWIVILGALIPALGATILLIFFT
jgi:hypothetical protein